MQCPSWLAHVVLIDILVSNMLVVAATADFFKSFLWSSGIGLRRVAHAMILIDIL